MKQSKTVLAGMTFALAAFSTSALAQAQNPADIQQAVRNEAPVASAAPAVKRVIVVSLEDRKLALLEDGQVKKVYSVAVGKPSTPSPTGTFTIARRVVNPTYHHGGRTVLPGPGNPVGTRWMGLSISGYGIHGTNEPKSIGKAASHGCIRMAKVDLEEFYELVAVGDTVELVGERNEETARLFTPADSTAAQTVATAAASAPAAAQGLKATAKAGEELAAAGVAGSL